MKNSQVVKTFKVGATIDTTDGFSLKYNNWRFNIRKSNTEPLIRLNVECKGSSNDLNAKVALVTKTIQSLQKVLTKELYRYFGDTNLLDHFLFFSEVLLVLV